LQTCAELDQAKKSHALQVEEFNIVVQLLDRDKDQLQQQVTKCILSCGREKLWWDSVMWDGKTYDVSRQNLKSHLVDS